MIVQRKEASVFTPFDVSITIESQEELDMLKDFFGSIAPSDMINVLNKTSKEKVESVSIIDKIRNIYDIL